MRRRFPNAGENIAFYSRHPQTFLSEVEFSFCLDSRLMQPRMTEKHWQPKEEVETTE